MDLNKQVKLFDKQANKYAKRLRQNTSDQKMRKRLLSSAKGHILEVSVGAGANFNYYPKDSKVTAVDFSPLMIEKAKEEARHHKLHVEYIVGNVEEVILPECAFDTVVSTLSLCSYPNPEKVLQLLNFWCKEDGQILLLEHGISSNSVFSWLQNRTDFFFAKSIGCHINRDILHILKQSPLHIKKMDSYMLGSVHLIWATPQ